MDKKPWTSKTLWVAMIMALIGFFPAAQNWVANNPQAFAQGMALVFMILRAITKGKVAIK